MGGHTYTHTHIHTHTTTSLCACAPRVNNSKLRMKQAARERTHVWFTVCVLCLYPVVTLLELGIRVTNLPFSWLPRIGLSGMDCKPAGQRSTRNKYAAHGI